jgi:MYXO-CTERM domain-containing protein
MFRVLYASAIAIALFALQIPGAATASTLTYNLTLTPLSGPEGGIGSLTITAPPVGSSGILTQGNGLAALDFKIDGLDFQLNNTSAVAYFYQGSKLVLASIGYSGSIGPDQLLSITLGDNGSYFFTDNAPGSIVQNTVGSISVSQTPLPTTLPLLATGLAALALLGLWRTRKVGTALAT